jgi:ABC-type amino acid transport substrate-binding protein
MKRFTGGIASLALALALLALAIQLWPVEILGRSAKQDFASTLDRVKTSGKFTVAVVPAPPISSINPQTGEPEGFAIDVIRQVAERAQLKIEFLPSDWATMSAALNSNKADVVVGPVFFSEGRAKDFIFTDPLLAFAIVAVVPAAQAANFQRSDLFKPGLRIAVGKGGFDAEFVNKFMPKAELKAFPPDDATLPLLEVASGRADVAIADFATADKFAKEHPTIRILFADQPLSLQFAGFMVRGGDEAWVRFLNVALRNMALSGDLKQIEEKYQSHRIWYGTVTEGWTLVK